MPATNEPLPLHEDRERAGSFGAMADRYDRTRPGYPPELYDFLLQDAPRTALDVGCGTGIAARVLLERGVDVLGLEPDPRMAAVARAAGIAVEIGAFETWERGGRTFDLLTAAQAWHWVNPRQGTERAAEALRPGGRIAVFWNLAQPPADVARHIDPVYARLAPELQPYSVVLGQGGGPQRLKSAKDALAAQGGWTPAEQVEFAQQITYATESWLGYLSTHSDHSTLPAQRREPLLAAVGQAIDAMGGQFVMPFRTIMVTALRS